MKLIFRVIIISIFLANGTYAQNLIHNPGFEDYDTVGYRNNDAIINPVAWFSGMGTADYWHEQFDRYYDILENKTDKGTIRPKNKVIQAHEGKACAAIYLYCTSVREYLATQLKAPLQAEKEYKVRFHYLIYSVGSGMKTWPDLTIQAALSTEPLNIFEPQDLFIARLLSTDPLSETLKSAKVQPNRWKSVEFSYRAKGGETYFTIGNFLPKENGEPNIYLFLDDVSVTEPGKKEADNIQN